MEENYYVVSSNVLTVNFAYGRTASPVYRYIKVSVSMKDSGVTGFEATAIS